MYISKKTQYQIFKLSVLIYIVENGIWAAVIGFIYL